MSKLEYINKYIKNAKISNEQLKKICHCFAYDFSASQTANELGISRQTINSYYKMIREFIVEEYDKNSLFNIDKQFYKKSFALKYMNVNSQIIYYILHDNTPYILNEKDVSLEKILTCIDTKVKDSLLSHKKANTARILYHSLQKKYFIATYSYSYNSFEKFVTIRLKKFRGLNKNHYLLHMKESIIRYKYNEITLFNSLGIIFNYAKHNTIQEQANINIWERNHISNY